MLTKKEKALSGATALVATGGGIAYEFCLKRIYDLLPLCPSVQIPGEEVFVFLGGLILFIAGGLVYHIWVIKTKDEDQCQKKE